LSVSTDPEALVAALRHPEAYPWLPATVEVIETHVSWVFLAGERVVKVKRPVVYPFVDFRDLASRHRSCVDEVRLNRRLTDGVYLDVVPIVQTAAGLRVGGEGAPVEWATLMRRLPASGMLDEILRSGPAPTDLGGRLALKVIPFHRDLCPPCGTGPAVADAATRIVTENLDELAPFAGSFRGPVQFGLVETAMRAFIAAQEALLLARAATGWIREGHGDLRSEHICLEPDGAVQIFDCVEFNRDLRCADVASDLAFLLMDLTRYEAEPAAAELLARYTAAGMDLPDVLLRLYWAHRALVRAKVACLKLAGADSGTIALAVKAADYLDLASAAALSVRPVLIAMTGLSGTGKSTVARRLAQALGEPIFASDVVRKDLAGVEGAAPTAWQEGIYRPEMTKATYDRLFALAGVRLAAGAPVVLDAAFLAAEQRDGAAAVAIRHGIPLVLVETVCDEATVAARLSARAKSGASASDATVATYARQRVALAKAPPVVPEGALAIRVDTAGDLPDSLDPVFTALQGAGIVQPVVPAAPACPPDARLRLKR
jgi:aminoglycoside phosphotransferase family enzyme/predicted kinase